jgi:predicted NAD/FAD-binding protein
MMSSPTSQSFSIASGSSYSPPLRQKVAIVGSGSAGIAALWALNRTYHDVYMYEATDRLGGHINTTEWRHGKHKTAVDTGFMVLNTETYPNFVNFLKKIKVKTAPTNMTLGVSRGDGRLEWADSTVSRLFCQPGNVASPRMWRMMLDVTRFNHAAVELLSNDKAPADVTVARWLDDNGYSDTFRDDYLMPMVAALWGLSPDQGALQFPIVTLVRYLWDSHLLAPTASSISEQQSSWLTLVDGSKSYIDAVMRGFPPNHLFLNTPVKRVRNASDGRVVLELKNGTSEVYDHVILACHGDQAFDMVKDSGSAHERDILSHFRTAKTTAILHSDASLMPHSRKAWSGWNYTTNTSSSPSPNGEPASITYNLNKLQSIPEEAFGNVLLTLNPDPLRMPDAATVQARFSYRHMLHTPESVAAQARLVEIQNTRGISYAGAWTRNGFHEDGFSSGLAVARDHLDAKLPFKFVDAASSREHARKPRFSLFDYVIRVIVLLLQIVLAFVAAVGSTVEEETALVHAKIEGAKSRVTETKQVVRSGMRHVFRSGHGQQAPRQIENDGANGSANGIANGRANGRPIGVGH